MRASSEPLAIVHALGEPDAPVEVSVDRTGAEARHRVRARNAELSAVMIALAREASLDVIVHAEVARRATTLELRSASLDEVLAAIAWALDVRMERTDGGTLRVIAVPTSIARRREELLSRLESALETRLVPLDGSDAAAFASAFCHHVATRRGRATALGDRVLLTDTPDALEHAERLLRGLRAPPGASAR